MDWKAARDSADEAVSLYVRKRDCLNSTGNMDYGICITCQKIVPYWKLDNGHFQDRACMATRFDEQNNNAQCTDCNRFSDKTIMIASYRHAIERKWGEGAADRLWELKKQTANFSTEDLLEIASNFRKKYREL